MSSFTKMYIEKIVALAIYVRTVTIVRFTDTWNKAILIPKQIIFARWLQKTENLKKTGKKTTGVISKQRI